MERIVNELSLRVGRVRAIPGKYGPNDALLGLLPDNNIPEEEWPAKLIRPTIAEVASLAGGIEVIQAATLRQPGDSELLSILHWLDYMSKAKTMLEVQAVGR